MWLPEHHSLQAHLFNHPHPGPWPTGTLAPLCESGGECKLNQLHTQWHILGAWLSRPFPSHSGSRVFLWNNYWNIKLQVVASSTDSLPSSDSGVLSGLLWISVVINLPVHISFERILLQRCSSPLTSSLQKGRGFSLLSLLFFPFLLWFAGLGCKFREKNRKYSK